jgi:uncharacterized protein (DUF433 family)
LSKGYDNLREIEDVMMSNTSADRAKLENQIVRDQRMCGGESVFRDTGVTLRTVLSSLADGDSAEDILADFPSLKPEDIRAAIAFAASSAEEDLPVPSVPNVK